MSSVRVPTTEALPSTKVALITAAARRIGRATAIRLHAEGLNIVIHYHSSIEEASQLCDELNALRADSAMIICCDLEAALEHFEEKLIQPTIARFGRLDVLVNNASQFLETPVGTVTVAQMDKLMKTNVYAPFFLSQAAAPYLGMHNGCIVNLTDAATNKKPYLNYTPYCATKGALATITRGLAGEFGGLVRVNAVGPGVIGMPEGQNELSSGQTSQLMSDISFKRVGEFDDIAQAVLDLVNSHYKNGTIETVDGGMSRAGIRIGQALPWAERTPQPMQTVVEQKSLTLK